MFNKDFYPTPLEVILTMGIECRGKVVLEPSAGKGDIVDFLWSQKAKEVLTCERDNELAHIVKAKSCFLKDDFLLVTAEEVAHVDMIVMNPPFSSAVNHVLHAYDIAPAGCEIISLINDSNVSNKYCSNRRALYNLIDTYGTYDNLGDVFNQAERNTDVEVGLIKLYKPNLNSDTEFEGFFLEEDEAPSGEGIVTYNRVQDIVSRYTGAVKCFDQLAKIGETLNGFHSVFGMPNFSVQAEYDKKVSTKDEYKRFVQKKAWKYIFDELNIGKYVTSGVMHNVNKFVEKQQNVPFTMKNIYRMVDIIFQNRSTLLDSSLEEAVDRYTKHTHENRYHVEGWKTNAGHLLNKKIIIPNMVSLSWCGAKLATNYNGYSDSLMDLVKVICFITGEKYDDILHIWDFFCHTDCQPGQWYSWGFFDIKGFKKGSLHLKFKNDKHWEAVNRKYAEIKGHVLPEKI
jgi:hypothetical protein